MVGGLPAGPLTRHDFETALPRFLTGAGTILFVALVLIPFYVRVRTGLKNRAGAAGQTAGVSIDLGPGLFRAPAELLGDFDSGSSLRGSTYVSILTAILTLLFSIPGAYAPARLRSRGRAAVSRAILLIYTVPMIVLALPIHIASSLTWLCNTIRGPVMIYPVTTIPVALYMLQGGFRGLPPQVEEAEAGLMDGPTRLQVIKKSTLSLPALASVSLHVFMIAGNEFLLACMLRDDPVAEIDGWAATPERGAQRLWTPAIGADDGATRSPVASPGR